jgi:rifampicin phosphotransferase
MHDVWGEDAHGEYVWTAGNVREAIPDVMTPCTWSVVQRYIEESAGPRIQVGHPLFGLIAGRLYMNMSVSATAAQRMGASWILDQISSQAFGTIPDHIELTPVEMSRFDALRTVGAHQMRVRMWTLANGLRLKRLLRDFAAECDRLLDEVPQASSAQELLALWRDRINPVFVRACKLVRFSAPAWMAMAVHYRIICALVGEPNANVVTSGSTGRRDLASLDLLLAIEELRAGRLDERTFARRYGHRGPHEHELSVPRPGEDPAGIVEQLRAPTAPAIA